MKHSVHKIVLIGASTGGPGEIQKIIKAIPILEKTSFVIGQHMVDNFMNSFANSVQSISKNHVSLAKNNQIFEKSYIYICQGETVINRGVNQLFFTQKVSSDHSYNPNINIIFNSFVPFCDELDILSIILTGIGDDGVEACKNLHIHNARCLTQNHDSAIVDGMPYQARKIIPDIEVYDMQTIIKIISEFCE